MSLFDKILDLGLQEGVAVEIAEAVVGALQGELAATAVNAPMVPAEVMYGDLRDVLAISIPFSM